MPFVVREGSYSVQTTKIPAGQDTTDDPIVMEGHTKLAVFTQGNVQSVRWDVLSSPTEDGDYEQLSVNGSMQDHTIEEDSFNVLEVPGLEGCIYVKLRGNQVEGTQLNLTAVTKA